MIYGELGRYPISFHARVRMVKFWCRLLHGEECKVSSLLYKLLFVYSNNYGLESKWLCFIKSTLDNCGMSNIWNQQGTFSALWISKCVEQKLKDQFIQEWYENMNSTSKGICYRIFKKEFKFEEYLSILPLNCMYMFCKFRCGSHRLPVETGRWHNLSRNHRLCRICGSAEIGDEYHYILSCKSFVNERQKYLPKFCWKNPNTLKLCNLFSSNNITVLEKLCRYIKAVNVKVSPPG